MFQLNPIPFLDSIVPTPLLISLYADPSLYLLKSILCMANKDILYYVQTTTMVSETANAHHLSCNLGNKSTKNWDTCSLYLPYQTTSSKQEKQNCRILKESKKMPREISTYRHLSSVYHILYCIKWQCQGDKQTPNYTQG